MIGAVPKSPLLVGARAASKRRNRSTLPSLFNKHTHTAWRHACAKSMSSEATREPTAEEIASITDVEREDARKIVYSHDRSERENDMAINKRALADRRARIDQSTTIWIYVIVVILSILFLPFVALYFAALLIARCCTKKAGDAANASPPAAASASPQPVSVTVSSPQAEVSGSGRDGEN